MDRSHRFLGLDPEILHRRERRIRRAADMVFLLFARPFAVSRLNAIMAGTEGSGVKAL
jgi:hypothetical protein